MSAEPLFDPGPAAAPAPPQDRVTRRAEISACGTYRYALWREDLLDDELAEDDQVLFVMLNPSTADGLADDRTIGRCIGFARSWGRGRGGGRARGPDNDDWITARIGGAERVQNLAFESAEIVAAWGACPFVTDSRVAWVLGELAEADGVQCLGTTASGAPRHPLYVPADQPREPYEVLS